MSGNLERYGLLKKNLNDSLRLQIETHILDTTHIVLTTLGSAGCMALEASANVEVVVVDEAAESVEPATLVGDFLRQYSVCQVEPPSMIEVYFSGSKRLAMKSIY